MKSSRQPHAHQPPQGNDRTDPSVPAAMFCILAMAETGLLAAVLLGVMTVWLAAFSHLALVASAALTNLRMAPEFRATSATGLFATLLTGVFGALGAAILIGWLNSDRASRHGADLESWYQRLTGQVETDRALDIHADIVAGRAMRRDTTNVPHLASVLETGELSAKQAILGFIGLNYHPDLLPILLKALASSDAIVRVQAAAVFAKLRETYKSRLRCCRADILILENTEDAPRAKAVATNLHACLISGFLDPSEQREAGYAVINLCAPLLASHQLQPEAERHLCRIVADAGAHDVIRHHLAPRAQTLDRELASLYFIALMQLGRSRELAEALRLGAAGNGRPMGKAQPATNDMESHRLPLGVERLIDGESAVAFHVR